MSADEPRCRCGHAATGHRKNSEDCLVPSCYCPFVAPVARCAHFPNCETVPDVDGWICDDCKYVCGCKAEAARTTPVTAPKPAADDPVNHPIHYTRHPSGVECIDVTEHMTFNLGNAIKYLWRADLKGSPIEDLEKAAWYVRREIERRKRLEEKR